MFQKLLKKVLPISFILLLAGGPLLGNSILKVVCLDDSGNPIKGVKVYLQGLGSQDKPEDEKSNRSGVAVFKGLPDDFYRVWAHQKKFESTYLEFIRLEGGQQQEVTLQFKPGDHYDRPRNGGCNIYRTAQSGNYD